MRATRRSSSLSKQRVTADTLSHSAPETIADVFRSESGDVIATLVRRFGDVDIAEVAVQEAFLAATERWPTDGVPPNPGGWIMTTARRKAIDRIRRESIRLPRSVAAMALGAHDDEVINDTGVIHDDRLRLVFTCCHPSLAPAAQVALTLRLLGGLQVDEIARAYFVPESTMAQRLVRAKRKIRDANIPYLIPEADDLPERVAAVLTVLYLIFNEGHTTTNGAAIARDDLTEEAIRLCRAVRELLPHQLEIVGLLALMLLIHARRAAREDIHGGLVRLGDQDRTKWNQQLIAEGHALVRECLQRNQPGPYQIQAAITAVHADARTIHDTDWAQIVKLYDQLLVFQPSPVVQLNRAIAVAELDGPEVALSLIKGLPLKTYHLYHPTRGEFLARLGQSEAAIRAFEEAISHTANRAEIDFLHTRISASTSLPK